jgi:hypothetical protein
MAKQKPIENLSLPVADDTPPFMEEEVAEQSAPSIPPVEEVVAVGKCLVVLAETAALGNGTREAGTPLGVADRKDGWFDESTLELADGVEKIEIENALWNPQLLKLES